MGKKYVEFFLILGRSRTKIKRLRNADKNISFSDPTTIQEELSLGLVMILNTWHLMDAGINRYCLSINQSNYLSMNYIYHIKGNLQEIKRSTTLILVQQG